MELRSEEVKRDRTSSTDSVVANDIAAQSFKKEKMLYEDLIFSLKQANEQLAAGRSVAETNAAQLKSENMRLQQKNNVLAHQLTVIRESFDTKTAQFESLHKEQVFIAGLAESYRSLESTADSLRSDLKEALGQLLTCRSKLMDSNHTVERYEKQEQKLLVREKELSILLEQEQMKRVEFEAYKDELEQQLEADENSKSAAAALVENLRKEIDFLNKAIHEFQDTNKRLMEDNSELKNDAIKSNEVTADLRAEIAQLKEASSLHESRAAIQIEEIKDALNAEIELLRSKLVETKKKIVHDNIDSEAGRLNASVILEREKQSKAVYEGIINELRADIDRAHSDNLKIRQQVDDLKSFEFEVEKLQEELKIYKETAELSRIENMK
jgi:chromosome segregation ATPase